jgi:hypothetical protein
MTSTDTPEYFQHTPKACLDAAAHGSLGYSDQVVRRLDFHWFDG